MGEAVDIASWGGLVLHTAEGSQQGRQPAVMWTSEYDPMEDLRKFIKDVRPEQNIRVDSSGVHFNDTWLMRGNIERNALETRVAVNSLAEEFVDKYGRYPVELGQRVNNTGPRPKQAFKRGRKQF